MGKAENDASFSNHSKLFLQTSQQPFNITPQTLPKFWQDPPKKRSPRSPNVAPKSSPNLLESPRKPSNIVPKSYGQMGTPPPRGQLGSWVISAVSREGSRVAPWWLLGGSWATQGRYWRPLSFQVGDPKTPKTDETSIPKSMQMLMALASPFFPIIDFNSLPFRHHEISNIQLSLQRRPDFRGCKGSKLEGEIDPKSISHLTPTSDPAFPLISFW